MGQGSRLHEAERHGSAFRPHDVQQDRPLPLHQLDAAQRRREGAIAHGTPPGTNNIILLCINSCPTTILTMARFE